MSVLRRPRSSSLLSSRSQHSHPVTVAQTSQAGAIVDDSSLLGGDRPFSSRRPRADSEASHISVSQRTPSRSFYHRSFHGPLDPAHYSSKGVREQTAELASLALSNSNAYLSSTPLLYERGDGQQDKCSNEEDPQANDSIDAIEEESEPVSPHFSALDATHDPLSRCALIDTIPTCPATVVGEEAMQNSDLANVHFSDCDTPRMIINDEPSNSDEHTPLIPKFLPECHTHNDLENQHRKVPMRHNVSVELRPDVIKIRSFFHILTHPKTWKSGAIWREGVLHPASLLPAVVLGLLLNILDALSYGMILFPLGQPVFENLGPDGIAVFYVSTIISQLVYSCGGSLFRGGVGSEMIEVVPFFHKMAFTILNRIGASNENSVLATTVLSFAISSIMTGIVFFLMGACRLGALIGFFPRHILIGCIGGVGWFLIATGVEVSARLDGNLDYNLETARKLFQFDTVCLWLVPLALAVILMIVRRFVKSNFLVGGYFILIAAIFYFFTFALGLPIQTLRDHGWLFNAPSKSSSPWHFYTLYNFRAVNWKALAETVPTMLALTFFGVLHVPINVPALGISTGEDNLDVDRELLAHGVSNALSGLAGSVQNYLVYTNSLLFIANGGDDRLAGIMLAVATFGMLLAGPSIIGVVPVMVISSLIYLLGIELLEEALVNTWGRVHRLEYLTIVIIVATMGAWDFVLGILIGIILACVNFVVQTSRKTAIRATYTGQVASSTVRRPPMQLHFLKEAGRQTFVIKLAGFLFFGTIVSVENRIRALLAEEAFRNHPIRFLILDLAHINGVDFSAAEAFTRVNRILKEKDVHLVISGIHVKGDVSESLRNVGLFREDSEVELFEDLNQALEFCENDLLKAFYRRQEILGKRQALLEAPTENLDMPRREVSRSFPAETLFSSPRRHHLQEVAKTMIGEEDVIRPTRWKGFKQPLPLLLQMLEGLSELNEDFWFRITRFFKRRVYSEGSFLFRVEDVSNGFYVLEEGILRADYDLPQGRYSELIVAGRPCGELPFFSETCRTATVSAEKACVVWQLDNEDWAQLQKDEPQAARELLKISLKLTKERMDAITSYVLTTAG